MTPTNKLRFVEREERHWHDDRTYSARRIRILQQWWDVEDGDHEDYVIAGGEWRDVPVETEDGDD